MNAIPLFPSTLFEGRVEENISQLNDLVRITAFQEADNLSGSKTHASYDTRILEKFPRIKKILLKNFIKFNNKFLFYSCDFAITTSWFTKTESGCFSQYHSHKNSFYSGIVYFGDYSENSSRIEFENPNVDKNGFYIIPDVWDINNSITFSVLPEKNKLIFFPSYLKHRISYGNDDFTRYSLAFNIVPIGSYGNADSFYDTKWFNQ